MHGLPAGVPTAVGVAAAILAVLWFMRRLSLRGQFVALVFVSVSIGVLLMTIVQVPRFPGWLAASPSSWYSSLCRLPYGASCAASLRKTKRK